MEVYVPQLAKKKIGRPTQKLGKTKRAALSFRTHDEIKQGLLDAAARSGRSLAQETEFRIEQSFKDQEIRDQLFGKPETYKIFLIFSAIQLQAEHETGCRMVDDATTATAIKTAFVKVLDDFLPKPLPVKSDSLSLADIAGSEAFAGTVLGDDISAAMTAIMVKAKADG